MKKIYKYIGNEKELNEEEKRTKKISYKRLINRICENMILCNKLPEIDESIFYNIEVGELGEYDEIYQYFLIDIDNYTIEKLQSLNIKDVIIAYSEILENYVLMVNHWGTSWDYVMTNIDYTTNFEKADL